MRVIFLKKFSKDLDSITDPKEKQAISAVINSIKNAQSLSDIPGVRKLSGYTDAFRIRCGNYRIGVFMENDVIEFARVAHRKNIYKIFP